MPALLGAVMPVWHNASVHAPSRCILFPPSCPRASRHEKCDVQASAESAALIPHPRADIMCKTAIILAVSMAASASAFHVSAPSAASMALRQPSLCSARHSQFIGAPALRQAPAVRARSSTELKMSLFGLGVPELAVIGVLAVRRPCCFACLPTRRNIHNRASAASCIEHLWSPTPDACLIRLLSHV
jgi:hypothetical protein